MKNCSHKVAGWSTKQQLLWLLRHFCLTKALMATGTCWEISDDRNLNSLAIGQFRCVSHRWPFARDTWGWIANNISVCASGYLTNGGENKLDMTEWITYDQNKTQKRGERKLEAVIVESTAL